MGWRPFHWEIEFPEVFARDNPGFDAIVGNPPFAGKNTIGGLVGAALFALAADHCTKARTATLISSPISFVAPSVCFAVAVHSASSPTNTIGQGDTRADGTRHRS